MIKDDLPILHETEIVSIESLSPHPRNYRGHPEDQIEHLVQSIRENGCYRNIVVARDRSILVTSRQLRNDLEASRPNQESGYPEATR